MLLNTKHSYSWRRSRASAAGRLCGRQPTGARSLRKEGVLPADNEASPFHELGLDEIWDGLAAKRMRQHVNPLAAQHQTPVTDADWAATFDDPTRPLVVDLGCGPGRFLLLLAKRNSAGGASSAAGAPGGSISGALASAAAAAADPRRSQHHDGAVNRPQQQQQQHGAAPTAFNYLGLEIRRPLVDRANEWAKRLGTHRTVAFLACNATISLGQLLASYPGRVVTFLIQYPDPHFKRRHRKRRIFQPQLIQAVTQLLPPGGLLLLQSDVLHVASSMRNCFEMMAGEDYRLSPLHADVDSVGGGGGAAAAAASSSSLAAAAAGKSVFFHEEHDEMPKAAAAGGARALVADAVGEAAIAAASAAARPSTATSSTSATTSGESYMGALAADDSEGAAGGDDASDASSLALHSSALSDGGTDDEEDAFVSRWARGGWLLDNPVGTPTEREHYVLQQNLPVYRVLLVRR